MRKILIAVMVLANGICIAQQNIGIGTTTPHSSAALDINSTGKGILIPRLTTVQRNAIASPAKGLMVFDNDFNSYWYYGGNSWKEVSGKVVSGDSSLIVGKQNGSLASYNQITNTSSNDSSGYLYDSGGPAGNYGNNETSIFTILGANNYATDIQVISNSLEYPYDTLFISGDGNKIDTLLGSATGKYRYHGHVQIRFKTNFVNTSAGFQIRWDQVYPGNDNTYDSSLLIGWYFNPEKIYVRGGDNFNNRWSPDSSGIFSFAFGKQVSAKGLYATATGYNSTAPGDNGSVSMGWQTVASGQYGAVAIGDQAKATGNSGATAFGSFTVANGFEGATALGSHTAASGSWAPTALGYRTEARGDYGSTALGHFSIASGDYGAMAAGNGAVAAGFSSIALGLSTRASGATSFAAGANSVANGYASAAIGNQNIANGVSSFASGYTTTALGASSMAGGEFSQTYGSGSFANGFGLRAKFRGGAVIGLYNDSVNAINATVTNPGDRIFQIGNGSANNDRSNAMTVLYNGNVGIGVLNPTQRLEVSGNITVQNGKGLIRSADGTQQKKITRDVVVNVSLGSLATTSINFTFPEAFSGTPDVYIGQAVSGLGGWAEVIMSLGSISATGGVLFINNPRTTAQNPNFTIRIIAMGPQ